MRGPVVTNKPKYRALADSIIERIRRGEFPPGSKIPSMRELRSEETGGERTVHEALRVLVTEGWVSTSVGRGTYVVDTLPDDPEPPLRDRVAELERRLAEAPTREEMDDLRSQLDAITAHLALDASGSSSATPNRARHGTARTG